MENNIPQMTFAIASKNNFRYVKYAIKYIRENCYRKDHIIHIGIDGEDIELETHYKNEKGIVISKGVSGIAAIYNKIAANLSTEFIVIYHADMIAGTNLDLHLFEKWKKGIVVSATRIEPPLHPGDPAKIVHNFGMWPEENVEEGFQVEAFNAFVKSNAKVTKTTAGVFAPWLIHKDDYWAVSGHDESLTSHSEDRDLFNRFLLKGFDFIQPWNALVYHLTCRGGQFEHANKTSDLTQKSQDWQMLAQIKTREFIRKWGSPPKYDEYQYPEVLNKYNVAFVVYSCSEDLLGILEPWCDRIYVDDKFNYIESEQPNTKFDLSKRVLYINENDPEGENNIVIEFNGKNFRQSSFNIVQNLSEIITDSGEIGTFELDCFKITIQTLATYEHELIHNTTHN